jgi:hypothetical protein
LDKEDEQHNCENQRQATHLPQTLVQGMGQLAVISPPRQDLSWWGRLCTIQRLVGSVISVLFGLFFVVLWISKEFFNRGWFLDSSDSSDFQY